MTLRRTLSAPTDTFKGLGLFTGATCAVTVRPSPAATGLLLTTPGQGPVSISTIRLAPKWAPTGWPAGLPVRNTTIRAGAGPIATLEHIMSALAGLGITDAVIEVQGPEVPILDGSSLPFALALAPLCADSDRPAEPIVLREAVEVEDGSGGTIVATPREEPGLSYTYVVDYGEGSPIPAHTAVWNGDAADYLANIAPARTFSLQHEAAAAQAMGLFKKFTPKDMLVVGADGKPIDNEWRMWDEPAKHKLLDLIGDLALLGRPLHADFVATKSGHKLTHELCKAIQQMLSI